MENTTISWCDHTFNAWIGCTKVNEACKFCYAEVHDNRFYNETHWGPKSNRLLTSDKYWNQPNNWNKIAGINKTKLRVFSSSLADIFEAHPQVDESRERLFQLIQNTPNLIWMLLTKRPENISKFIPWNWHPKLGGEVPANVRFGVSIGNQKQFDEMWPVMEDAMYSLNAEYFISMEPLIGAIEFAKFDESIEHENGAMGRSAYLPQYIIVGGETGPKARPMHPDWVDKIKYQCSIYSIVFHFKQWGEWQNGSNAKSKRNYIVLNNGEMYDNSNTGLLQATKNYGNNWQKYNPTVMCKVGKQLSGDKLDGRQYKALID